MEQATPLRAAAKSILGEDRVVDLLFSFYCTCIMQILVVGFLFDVGLHVHSNTKSFKNLSLIFEIICLRILDEQKKYVVINLGAF